MDIIEAVSCTRCKKLMKKDSRDFILVSGNVYIGVGGGLIGNNLSPENKVINNTIMCSKCFLEYIEESISYV